MEETRVQKWKAYRESLIKQEAPVEDNNNSFRNINVKDEKEQKKTISATSTLPINDVIKGISNNEEVEKKNKLPFILKIIGFSIIVIAIVVGVVFLGIWAYGGK